jgi:hypothetical protein
VSAFRQIYELGVKVVGTIFGSAFYGAMMSAICYFSWSVSISPLGKAVGQLIYDSSVGLSTTLATKIGLSATLGPWLLVGIPASMFVYHFAHACLTGQLSASISQHGYLKVILKYAAYFLPVASFVLTFGTGYLGMTSALWLTFGLGTAAGLSLSDLGQALLKPLIDKKEPEAAAPPASADSATDKETAEPDPKNKKKAAAKKSAAKPAEKSAAKPAAKTARKSSGSGDAITPAYKTRSSKPAAKAKDHKAVKARPARKRRVS